jgi:hypothetical protein
MSSYGGPGGRGTGEDERFVINSLRKNCLFQSALNFYQLKRRKNPR